MLYRIKACLKNIFYQTSKIEYQEDIVQSRTIREFNYETLLNNSPQYARRRFYDLDIMTILNDMNYTVTNAGEQYLLQHFLTGNSIKQQTLTAEEEMLIKQIGYDTNLSYSTFFADDYSFRLPRNHRIAYSLILLPLWLVLGYFFKIAFFLLFIQLLVNYIISLYYEERLRFIEVHLTYLLNISAKINHSAVTPEVSDQALRLLKHLKYKSGLASDANSGGNELSILLSGVRKIFLMNLLEVMKYYRLFIANKAQFEEVYAYIAALDLARLRNICLTQLDVVNSKVSDNFDVTNMYHPLIEECKMYTLAFDNRMLITGTNASGKSIFLKTVGINLLFSNVLGFAFADEFIAPKLDIITSIDITDNLFESESLFVAELQIIEQVLNKKKYLAIIDEPFRGTNASESAALVYALIKTFHQEQRCYLISTHHKTLAYEEYESRRYYFDENQEKYHLYHGVGNSTNAITLADGIIADEQFCDLARSYLAK